MGQPGRQQSHLRWGISVLHKPSLMKRQPEHRRGQEDNIHFSPTATSPTGMSPPPTAPTPYSSPLTTVSKVGRRPALSIQMIQGPSACLWCQARLSDLPKEPETELSATSKVRTSTTTVHYVVDKRFLFTVPTCEKENRRANHRMA